MGKTAEDLRQDLEHQRESVGRDLEAIGDRVSPGRMVERRRMAVRQSFGRARDAVMGARDTAAGRTQHAASTVGDVVTSTPQAIQSQTQGNPMAAGLVAFGLGALAGSILPTTRREEQAVAQVQPALESAAGELADGAQSLVSSAKEHAAEGAEHLKETVRGAAESVKADAQGSTQSTATPAQGWDPPRP